MFCFLALSPALRAQLIYQEDFSYSGTLSSHGWVPFSNTGNSPINAGATGLTYAGYFNSGVGNAVAITSGANAEGDEHAAAADITGGSMFVGFLINVQSSTGNGKVVLNFNTNGTTNFPNSGFTLDASHFGVVTNGTTTYSASTYVNSTTYFLVMELSNATGKYSLYINPVMGGAKPAPAASTALITGTKPTLVNAIRIFQNGTTNSSIDGIRVGKSWSDIVGGGPGMMLHEDFNSGTGTLTGNGWSLYNGSSFSTATPPLNLTGYGSGTGKSVVITNNAAYFKSFPPVTSGVIYAGFLIKVQSFNTSPAAGHLNFYSSAASNAFNYQQGFVANDNVSIILFHNTNFGVKYNSNSIALGPSVNTSTTYLLVLGYDLSTNKYSLWVSPTVGGASPPAADVIQSAGTTVTSIDGISLAGDGNDDLNMGEIHVSTNWHDVVSYAPPPQPTNLLTTATTSSVQLTFTAAASGNPSGYLTLRSTTGPPDTNPVKGVSLYTSGQTLGNATVISSGSATTVNDNSVTPGTTYYYSVYSYGSDGTNYVYQTIGPLQGIVSTAVCCPPSSISFAPVTNTSVTVNMVPPGTPPTGYLVLNGSGVPAQGAVYSPGDHIGTATVVGYTTSATITDSGLIPASNYTYTVYSYGGSNFYSYNLSGVTKSIYTLANPPSSQPTSLTFPAVTNTTTDFSFTAASGSPNYLVLRKAGSAPTFPGDNPVNATTYSAGSTIGSSTVVYSGAATSFSQSSLTPGTDYFYAVFSYTSTVSSTENYLTNSPLTGNSFTLATAPTNQPTALSFTNVDNTSTTVSFSAAIGSPAGYLVLRKAGSAPSFPSDNPLAATAYTAGNSLGGSTVAYSGSGTTFSNTGLTPATAYYYAVFSYNGSGVTLNYLTTSPLTGNRFTLSTPPIAQPTALTFPSVTNTTTDFSFTGASGSPKYLVLRKAGSAPTFPGDNPVNATTYSAGSTIGSSTVVYSSAATSFSQSSLTPGTDYFYAVFSYTSTVNSTENYLTNSPLTGNSFTLATAPTNQPTALSFTNVDNTSMTVSFSPALGSAAGYLVLRKSGSAPSFPSDNPLQATAYTAGNSLGGSTVAYSGSGTSFSDTGLSPATTYYYAVVSYNGSAFTSNYYTVSPLQGSKSTLANPPSGQPTGLLFSGVTNTSMTVGYTAAPGSPSGYLVIRKPGSAPVFPGDNPLPGIAYTAGNTIGGSTVVYSGTGISIGDTGLTPATAYFYAVFSYTGSGVTLNYLTTSPLTGNKFTLSTAPIAQPTSLTFASVTNTTTTVSFTAASGSPNYLILRKAGSAPTFPGDNPVNATTYSAGNTLGSSTVAYSGPGTSFSQSSLTPDTDYFYAVFSYASGANGTENYLTTAPLTGNTFTLSTPPIAQPTSLTFSSVTNSTTTISFTGASGSPKYLVLRKAGSAPVFPGDNPVNATTYLAGNSVGSSTVAYVGSGTSFPQSGLTPATDYFYAIFSFTSSVSGTENYLTNSPLAGNSFTVATAPTAQPSALSFTNFDNTSMTVSFSAATGSPGGYLVLRKAGSAPSFPSDNPLQATAYTAGNSLGGSTVAYSGSGTSFSDIGLSPATTYYYAVFSYNGSALTLNYYTVSPLQSSKSTLANPPSGQPTGLLFSAVTNTSMTVSFSPATGSPSGYLVLRKQGSPPFFPSDNPLPGTAYTAGNSIGVSTVAYSGSGTSFSETGLSVATTYYYAVFAYNGSTVTLNYLTTGLLQGSKSTLANPPIAQPTGLLFSGVTNTSMTVGYTAASGSPAGYLMIRKEGSAPLFPADNPLPGIVYTAGNTVGSSMVVYSGNGLSFADAGLTPATTYYYAVFSYTGAGVTLNYLTTSPLSNNKSTLSTAPIAQPGSLTFTNPTVNSVTISYPAATDSPSGYFVLRKLGSAPVFPTDNPVAGNTYTAGNTIGGSTVAYVGSALTFSESGLSTAANYFYAVFSYNGSGTTTNYLTLSPQQGNTYTLETEPSAQPTNLVFNSITQTSYTVAFTAATGSPTGYIVLRRTGASPTGVPSVATSYPAGNTIGDGVVVFVGSATTFPESGLTSGTPYYYDVYSYNGSGGTLNYRTSTGPLENNTITIPPDPIAGAATADNPTGFTANWSSSIGAAGYQLYVSTDAGFASGFVAGYNPKLVSVTSNVLTGLAIATPYYYRVSAVNASGPSGMSASVSVTTQSPPPVANPATAITTTSFQANWVASPGASGYELDISSDNFSSFLTGYNSKAISVLSDNVTGLSPNTSYQYQVRAESTGVSGNSNYISVLTLPDAPVVSVSAVTGTSFTASWGSVSGITTYALDLSTDNFATVLAGYDNVPVNGTSTNLTGRTPGTTYQVRVRTVNATGPSANSNVVSVLMIPPAPAVSVGTSVRDSSFTANWAASPGATDYFLDVATDNGFVAILSRFNNLHIVEANSPVTGLRPGAAYYYRVRASNATGTSGNSNTIVQFTVTVAPVSQPFTAQSSNSFIANWDPVSGADGYELDVSANSSFIDLIQGYNPETLSGGSNSQELVSLPAPGKYYYRVRAHNPGGVSANSAIKLAVTSANVGQTPAISVIENQNSTQSVKGSVSFGYGVITVVLSHRKILETNFTAESPATLSGSSIEIPINAGFLDDLGMEYYFTVTDELSRSSESPHAFVYTTFPFTPIPIIAQAVGGKAESYRIFSIPLQLSSTRIEDIFQPIIQQYGGIDKTQWRLVHYQNKKNVDYGGGLTTIDPGRGYWFNSLDPPQTVGVSGSVTQVNQRNGFVLSLDAGFTQIGNPLPFNVSWSDVLAQNATVAGISGVGSLYTYDAPRVAFNKNAAILKAWEGGFVHSDAAIQLTIPVTIKQARIGGGDRNEIKTSAIDQPEWFVPITITQGITYNTAIGPGMHPDAEPGYDRFDDFTMPRFVSYLEMNSYHPDYHTPKFSRDIVPTGTHYNWSYEVESNFDEQTAEMTWDNHSLGDNAAQLLLYDIAANMIVDMKKENSYRFGIHEKHSFKIFFGADEKSLSPDINGLGRAFPNPFNQSVTIPFISSAVGPDVVIAMYDMMGRKIRELANGRFEPGYHEAVWDGSDDQGGRVSEGVYIYRLSSSSAPAQMGRVVLK